MKGIIIEKAQGQHTYLKNILLAINNKQFDYNWLITNYECYPQTPKIAKMFSSYYCWISGEKLMQVVHEENFQWIWGVFYGFRNSFS